MKQNLYTALVLLTMPIWALFMVVVVVVHLPFALLSDLYTSAKKSVRKFGIIK